MKCLIIINRLSGNGKKADENILRQTFGNGLDTEVFYVRKNTPTPDLLPYDRIVACGGDGTLNRLVNNKTKQGAQVFYSPRLNESKVLAETIQQSFKEMLQPNNKRAIKPADKNLYLLYNNDVTPAVIVECGFISNPGEAELLKTDSYQDRVAMTICYSLMKYNNREEARSTAE